MRVSYVMSAAPPTNKQFWARGGETRCDGSRRENGRHICRERYGGEDEGIKEDEWNHFSAEAQNISREKARERDPTLSASKVLNPPCFLM